MAAVLLVNFPPDARLPHIRAGDAAPPKCWRTLCGKRTDPRDDVGRDLPAGDWSPVTLLGSGFLCRACARKARWV